MMSEWHWPHFKPEEVAQKGGTIEQGRGEVLIVPDFLDKLEYFRVFCAFPFIISSWYRSPEYNNIVSSTGKDGPHTTGMAVDILAYGERALMLVEHARQFGFTGIGVSQKGPHHTRFIHLDDLDGKTRPAFWGY